MCYLLSLLVSIMVTMILCFILHVQKLHCFISEPFIQNDSFLKGISGTQKLK